MDEGGNLVDYGYLSIQPEYQDYCGLVSQLHNLDLNTLDTPHEQMAFWINLYNTLVIDAVIQFEVEESVTENLLGIISFFQRAAYTVGGLRFSLTDIEHGVLRGNRGFPYLPGVHFDSADLRRKAVIPDVDPRIHFALNCASRSCPPIGVYSPDNLDFQLDLATKNFINSDAQLDNIRRKISLSSIFRWYQVDFGGGAGIIDFLIRHFSDDEIRDWIKENRDSVRMVFKPYNWGLNRM
jgi:hypothetical protein